MARDLVKNAQKNPHITVKVIHKEVFPTTSKQNDASEVCKKKQKKKTKPKTSRSLKSFGTMCSGVGKKLLVLSVQRGHLLEKKAWSLC